jgi:hypothetical protein
MSRPAGDLAASLDPVEVQFRDGVNGLFTAAKPTA